MIFLYTEHGSKMETESLRTTWHLPLSVLLVGPVLGDLYFRLLVGFTLCRLYFASLYLLF